MTWYVVILLIAVAAWAVWTVLSQILLSRKRNRFQAAGMDVELSGRLAKHISLGDMDAVLAHWRNPDTVTQWVENGRFKWMDDHNGLFLRKLTENEKRKLVERHRH